MKGSEPSPNSPGLREGIRAWWRALKDEYGTAAEVVSRIRVIAEREHGWTPKRSPKSGLITPRDVNYHRWLESGSFSSDPAIRAATLDLMRGMDAPPGLRDPGDLFERHLGRAETVATGDAPFSGQGPRWGDEATQRFWGTLPSRTIPMLATAPDYYPKVFDSLSLAGGLQVHEIAEHEFGRFAGQGLYWGGSHASEPAPLTRDQLREGTITVVLGDPGSGKTTLARALVIQEYHAGRPALFARLDDLARHSSITLSPLASVIVAHVAGIGGGITPDQATRFAELWPSVPKPTDEAADRPLVVLDALDELPTATGMESARRTVRALADAGHPVVITSRVAGYSQPWNEVSAHYGMAPLTEDAQRGFTQSWFEVFDGAAKGRLEQALGEIPNDLLQSPLTLGFVCLIAQTERVPIHRAGIFDRFVDHVIRGPWRNPEMRIVGAGEVSRHRRYAEECAWLMAGVPGEVGSPWRDTVMVDWLQLHLADGGLDELSAVGLLLPHGHQLDFGSSHQQVRWLHRTVHENLVAVTMAKRLAPSDESWRSFFLDASLHYSWREALVQLAEFLGESEQLHAVLDYLRIEVLRHDTPCGEFAGVLSVFARMCTCPGRRRQLVQTMLEVRRPDIAVRIDVDLALELRLGGQLGDEDVWLEIIRSGAASGVGDLALEAYDLGHRGYFLKQLVANARGTEGTYDSFRALLRSRADDTWEFSGFARRLDPPALEAFFRALTDQILEAGSPALATHQVVSWVTSADPDATAEQFGDDHPIGVVFQVEAAHRTHMGLPKSIPSYVSRHASLWLALHAEDGPARRELFRAHADLIERESVLEVDLPPLRVVQQVSNPGPDHGSEAPNRLVAGCFCGREMLAGWPLAPGAGEVGVALLEHFYDLDRPLSPDQLSRLSWCIKALIVDPRVESIPLLIGIELPHLNGLRQPSGFMRAGAGNHLDSNEFTLCLNRQPWLEFSRMPRQDPFLRGMALTTAAGQTVNGLHGADNVVADDREALALFLDGLRLLVGEAATLLACSDRSQFRWGVDFPDRLTAGPLVHELMPALCPIIADAATPVRNVVLRNLEYRLSEQGLLPFYRSDFLLPTGG